MREVPTIGPSFQSGLSCRMCAGKCFKPAPASNQCVLGGFGTAERRHVGCQSSAIGWPSKGGDHPHDQHVWEPSCTKNLERSFSFIYNASGKLFCLFGWFVVAVFLPFFGRFIIVLFVFFTVLSASGPQGGIQDQFCRHSCLPCEGKLPFQGVSGRA